MNIDFNYKKEIPDFVSGYIFKGNNYRCSYIRYKSLYRSPAKGSEQVELYNFQPKSEIKASSLILHGLGSRNIKFLLWIGPHLASAGINTSILILPGNYTRVENNSVSGKSYLYPDIDILYKFWEHGVVDVLSTLDLLEHLNLWKENSILTGYCLGGMISSIVSAIDDRIAHTLFMATGGHLPKILHESPVAAFARRLFATKAFSDYDFDNKDKLYKTYNEQFPLVKTMTKEELFKSEDIHPLFKIDPISYAHFLDKKKITFLDAYFDNTLPLDSRKILYDQMKGGKRRILPISHVTWLPFSYFLGKYILHKVHITDKHSQKNLFKKEKIQDPLDK